jgi:hypothetical protein
MEIRSHLNLVIENIQAYQVVISNFHIQFLNKNIPTDKVLNCTHNIKLKSTILEYEVSFRLYLEYEWQYFFENSYLALTTRVLRKV